MPFTPIDGQMPLLHDVSSSPETEEAGAAAFGEHLGIESENTERPRPPPLDLSGPAFKRLRLEHEGERPPEVPGVTTPRGTVVPQHALDQARALQNEDPRTRDATGRPTAFGHAIGKHGTSDVGRNGTLNHVGRAMGQQMLNAGTPNKLVADSLGVGRQAVTSLKKEVEAARPAASPSLYEDPGAPGPNGTANMAASASPAAPAAPVVSGRIPDVMVGSLEEAQNRSWNAGDRFQIIGEAGEPPQHVRVLQDRQGGVPFARGEIQREMRGG